MGLRVSLIHCKLNVYRIVKIKWAYGVNCSFVVCIFVLKLSHFFFFLAYYTSNISQSLYLTAFSDD